MQKERAAHLVPADRCVVFGQPEAPCLPPKVNVAILQDVRAERSPGQGTGPAPQGIEHSAFHLPYRPGLAE